jgi:hypothetical protein
MCIEVVYPNDFILITWDTPFNCIKSINGFNETIIGQSEASFFKRFFRYSIDGLTFSSWLELNNDNLFKVNGDGIWIEVKYEKCGDSFQSLQLTHFNFNITECDVESVNSTMSKACKCEVFSPESVFDLRCSTVYDYYNIGNLAHIQEDLADAVVEMFGHCIDYYRVKPDLSTEDNILNEYSLYNYSKKSTLKVMLPENKLPSSEPTWSPFGLTYQELPLVLHITKNEFECHFGEGTQPQQYDFIFFPLANMWYRIENTFFKKDFMGTGTYYVINCYKRELSKSIDINTDSFKGDENLKLEIDETMESMADLFSAEIESEIQRVTNKQQLTPVSNDLDTVRQFIDSQVIIERFDLMENWTTFSKNHYNLSAVDSKYTAVKYHNSINFKSTLDYTLSCWFNLLNNQEKNIKKSILNISSFNQNVLVSIDDASHLKEGDIIKLTNSGTYNGSHLIKSIQNNNVILETIFSSNVITSNSYIQKVNTSILFNGTTSLGEGFGVIVSESGVIIKINKDLYFYSINLSINKWYGIVIGIENNYNILSLNLYCLDENIIIAPSNKKTSKINKIYRQTINLKTKLSVESDEKCRLTGGFLKITNIKLANKIIEEELHTIHLTRYLENDAQYFKIIDTAVENLRLPRLTKVV